MSLLVVGSVAYDTIENPHGGEEGVLGGSGTYAGLAASLFAKPGVVGIVGNDFKPEHRKVLTDHGINLTGLRTDAERKTFHWKGRYYGDLNTRDTVGLELNCLEGYKPEIPAAFRNYRFLLLANMPPAMQMEAQDQMTGAPFTVADTVDDWIRMYPDDMKQILPRVGVILLNDTESRMLSGCDNLVKAGREIQAMGADSVLIKKGEHGSLCFHRDDVRMFPAYPVEHLVDPTGAGDSFSGAFLGQLSREKSIAAARFGLAIAYATVVASFAVEAFGPERLASLMRHELDARFEAYCGMIRV